MSRFSVRLVLCALALAVMAVPAFSEVYHIRLHNGSVFDTAVQPEQSSWDPNVVLVLSDVGNWIGLDQRDIDRVDTESSVRGFGVAINNTTIAIGWAPNDAADQSQQQQNQPTAADQAMQQLLQMQQNAAHYSVPQGVQSEQTQGIPGNLITGGATGLTGNGGFIGGGGGARPVAAPVAPAPTIPVAVPSAPPGTGGNG